MSTDDSDNDNLLTIKQSKTSKRPAKSTKKVRRKRAKVEKSLSPPISPSTTNSVSDESKIEKEHNKVLVEIPDDKKSPVTSPTSSEESLQSSDEEAIIKGRPKPAQGKLKLPGKSAGESKKNVTSSDENHHYTKSDSNPKEEVEKSVDTLKITSGKDKQVKNHAKKKSSSLSSSDSDEMLAGLRADKKSFFGKNCEQLGTSGKKEQPFAADNSRDAENLSSKKDSTTDLKDLGPNDKEESSASENDSHNGVLKKGVKKSSANSGSRNSEESSRFKRLRKLAILAGLGFKYRKQIEGIKSDSKKCRILKEFMIEQGITKFTVKDCKEFRVKKAEEAEVAELSKNQIIGPDSTRRVTRGSRRLEESNKPSRKAHLSTSSSDNASEREEMVEQNRQLFSRLKGIVSDESD